MKIASPGGYFSAAHFSGFADDVLALDGSPPPPQSMGQVSFVSPQDLTHWPSPQRPQRAEPAAAGVAGAVGAAGATAGALVDRQSAGQVRSFSQEGAQ